MSTEMPRNMKPSYDIASLWRPQMRNELLGNVVQNVYIDDEESCGYAVFTDFGVERFVHFDTATGAVTAVPADFTPIHPDNPRSPLAPDQKHRLESREHNLWLIDLTNNRETQLTSDGNADFPYGQGRQAKPYDEFMKRPLFLWSPDSRYAVTQRLDLRGVNKLTLVESAPRDGGLPKTHTFIDGFPGDAHVPHVELLIIDTQSGSIRPVAMDPIAATHTSPLMRRDMWWDDSTGKLYLVHSTRDWLQLSLVEISPSDGSVQRLVHEEATKRIRPNPMFHQEPCVAINNLTGTTTEAIWFSERDGWGHLYLYDTQTGACQRQITKGEWVVSRLLKVDWTTRKLWASVAGLIEKDIYRETLCSIEIDSGKLTRVFDDDQDHRVQFNLDSLPWFVDAASTVSEPFHYTVRSWDGEILADLGSIDIARLKESGWREPERFRTKSVDGVTDIYGTMFFPPNFDPTRSYPVIDHVYPGPQLHRSVPYFEADEVEPYAALGMIGVTIDGRGTPMRNRAFCDQSWKNLGDGSGLDDHVAAIRELATTRPWIDTEHVAVHGRSAGGYATARAMELFPDFYKVGIAAAGRFEGRMVMAMILEAYDHPYDSESWKRASAIEAADQITGKFLIVQGEMDVDCTIPLAYRLIDRLIEANRDFDLIVVPGDDHVFSNRGNYVERRIWDYLTEHALLQTPPRGYRLS